MAAIAIAAGVAWWWSGGRRADPPAAPAPLAATAAPATPGATSSRLLGRWVRTDGGYVLEIRGVEASGRVDAAYFNPRPIHVARAHATQEGAAMKLLIELRDVNYPGSTYRLRHDPGRDILEGTYFQALERQSYDVSFVRR